MFNRGEAKTVAEALQVLTDQGNEAAAAFLAYYYGPAAQEFARALRLAVDADPYWAMGPDGIAYNCEPGARYTTPLELVAAYRRNNNLE